MKYDQGKSSGLGLASKKTVTTNVTPPPLFQKTLLILLYISH